MNYVTIYRTAKENRILLLKGIFEENNIAHRILKETNPANIFGEVKVQVRDVDRTRAVALLKENGFVAPSPGKEDSVSMARFWLWLVIALLAIITASFFINHFLRN